MASSRRYLALVVAGGLICLSACATEAPPTAAPRAAVALEAASEGDLLAPAPHTVRVGSFNIQVFGVTKRVSRNTADMSV